MDEQALNEKYPGRMVYREGDRIVVKIPVQFRRRNGRQMIVAADEESQGGSEDNALALVRLPGPGSGRKNWSPGNTLASRTWPEQRKSIAVTPGGCSS